MTSATNSMSIPVQEQSLQQRLAPRVRTPVSRADVEAQRLAVAVGRGEEAAFQELYNGYRQRLFRLALVLSRGDQSLAQDTVQSVFLAAAGKLRRIEGESHLWNWLARVARQQCAKLRRKGRRDSVVIAMAELPERPDEVEPDSLLEENLEAALHAMEADERWLIEAFYFDRLSHKEIAEQFKLTPKAVSSRLERARGKLRSLMIRKLSYDA